MKSTALIFLFGFFLSVASSQVPNWYSTHTHSNYPASEYIVGVGSGSGATGAETAKKSALSDIASQLRVQIQSEMKSVTESFSVNDDEQIYSDFKRQSRTMVSDEITGAEVISTVVDEPSSTTYALVVLNRDKYSAGLRAELEGGWKQASDLRTAAGSYFAQGKLNEAVQSTYQIKQVIAPLFAKQVLHNAAARSPFTFPSVFNPAALQNDIRSFLSQVKLVKKSGDVQKGKIGEKFAQPFVLTVTANGVPCTGVTVSFLLDGKIPIGDAITDDGGTAYLSTIIRNGNSVKAKLSVPGIGREFEQNLNSSTVSFSWIAQASDKAFSLSVNGGNKKVENLVQKKLSTAISQIGYKVVTMSNNTLNVELNTNTPSKIEGMAGTLYNLTLQGTVNLKNNASNAILGSFTFSSKGVGKSEDEALEKAASGVKIDQNDLSELLQK
ncbi:MAG: LPP20 family lipoprotein [Bacteroidota bacterium]